MSKKVDYAILKRFTRLDDCSSMICEAKYETIYRERLPSKCFKDYQ